MRRRDRERFENAGKQKQFESVSARAAALKRKSYIFFVNLISNYYNTQCSQSLLKKKKKNEEGILEK